MGGAYGTLPCDCAGRGAGGGWRAPGRPLSRHLARPPPSGLDNAGKTTIVKRLNGEDISTISPTLGFNIKTMEFRGRARRGAGARARPLLHACVRFRPPRAPGAGPRPPAPRPRSYKLNIWDVGGQKTLRPYWRNYYEKTDGLIWVVDAADLGRLEDCAAELRGLLQARARARRGGGGAAVAGRRGWGGCAPWRRAGARGPAPARALAPPPHPPTHPPGAQEERLFGSTLLVLANKQDIPSALSLRQIEEVGKMNGWMNE